MHMLNTWLAEKSACRHLSLMPVVTYYDILHMTNSSPCFCLQLNVHFCEILKLPLSVSWLLTVFLCLFHDLLSNSFNISVTFYYNCFGCAPMNLGNHSFFLQFCHAISFQKCLCSTGVRDLIASVNIDLSSYSLEIGRHLASKSIV